MSHETKRAWYNEDNKGRPITIRVHASDRHGLSLGMDVEAAKELRDQLAQAIQEAEANDPFEVWWNGLPGEIGKPIRLLNSGLWIGKQKARIIWDAARKESGK